MEELLFASTNKGKLEQFTYVADQYNYKVSIVSAYKRFPHVHAYSEDFKSQQEIVEHGAREIFGQIQKPVTVEDTILEVQALHHAPGLASNDYLKTKGRRGLLEDMKGVDNRKATITSILGYYDGKIFITFKTVIAGLITRYESYKRGEPIWVGPTLLPFGGGFNAIFLSKEVGKTLADLTAEEGLRFGYREPNFKAILQYVHV